MGIETLLAAAEYLERCERGKWDDPFIGQLPDGEIDSKMFQWKSFAILYKMSIFRAVCIVWQSVANFEQSRLPFFGHATLSNFELFLLFNWWFEEKFRVLCLAPFCSTRPGRPGWPPVLGSINTTTSSNNDCSCVVLHEHVTILYWLLFKSFILRACVFNAARWPF